MAKRTLSVWMMASAGVLALGLTACGKSEVDAPATEVEQTVATAPPVGPVPAAVAPPAEVPAAPAAAPVAAAVTPAATPAAKAAAPPVAPAMKAASPTPAAKAPASNPTPAAATPATKASSGGSGGGAGKALMEQNCTACHALDVITSQRKTEAEWRGTVEQMIGYGAPVSDAEFPQIVSYLARNHGR